MKQQSQNLGTGASALSPEADVAEQSQGQRLSPVASQYQVMS